MKTSIDFVKDSIPGLIFKTSIPIVLASLVTMIVQLANISFMGNVSEEAIYIRALYTPFAFLSIALTEAFQISNQVSIARLKGSNDKEGIKRNIFSFIALSMFFTSGLAILIYLVSPYLSTFFNVPANLSGDFNEFLRNMFLTNILIVITMIFISSLRGYGNIYLSTILNIIYAFINIALVYWFSFRLEQGLNSIIYANLFSSVFVSGIAAIFLVKFKILKINVKHLKKINKALLVLRNVGLPISLSYVIIFLSNFLFTKIVEPFGPEAISGFGVAYNIQTFAIIPAIAIGSGLGIIMNYNIGAGEPFFSRVFKTFKVGILITFAFYLVFSSLIFISKESIANLMLNDNESINNAVSYLRIVAPSYLFMGVVLMIITTLEKINKGLIALILNVAYFLTIILISWILTIKYDILNYFYWTIFFSNIIGFLGMGYIYLKLKKEFEIPGVTEEQDFIDLQLTEDVSPTDIALLFSDPEFRFKTLIPNYLGEDEILSLLNKETVVIHYEQQMVGLVEFEEVMEAARHYKLIFRVKSEIEIEKITDMLNEIISSFVIRTQVIKLSVHCYENDKKYIELLKRLGFEVEGVLENMLNLQENSTDLVYFHKFITRDDLPMLSENVEVENINRFTSRGDNYYANGL